MDKPPKASKLVGPLPLLLGLLGAAAHAAGAARREEAAHEATVVAAAAGKGFRRRLRRAITRASIFEAEGDGKVDGGVGGGGKQVAGRFRCARL